MNVELIWNTWQSHASTMGCFVEFVNVEAAAVVNKCNLLKLREAEKISQKQLL